MRNDRSLSWTVRELFNYKNKVTLVVIGSCIMNMVIAKYHGLSASCRSIICLRQEIIIIISFLRLLIDIILLPTHKPWCFVQPRPVIVNYVIGTELYPRKSSWIKFALTLYYIHFEITGYPCKLIGSQQCNLFPDRTIFCSKSHLFLSQWE